MNSALIPFIVAPAIAVGVGIALIVMAVTGDGPHNSFLLIGAALVATGVVLPMLFWIVTKPRRRR
jgi:high-affinity Fe2+/Pb2+ permease